MRSWTVSSEVIRVERQIAAPAATIFGVLSDPSAHAVIDGTGWVCQPRDPEPLTHTGQRFRMAMHHDQHPDKNYEMTNEVIRLEEPHAIAWRPGQPDESGTVQFGGWVWSYELAAIDAGSTTVTLIYDWSAASSFVRSFIDFPPFGADHLDNSLDHLAELAGRAN